MRTACHRLMRYTHWYQCICNTYTTGTSALPEIYAQAQELQAQGCVHLLRQSISACGIITMYHDTYAG